MLTALISLYASSKLLTAELAMKTAPIWSHANLLEASTVPHHNTKNIAPVIKAKSAIAVDLNTGFVLYEKESNDHRPIASITKIMTATIILEENKLTDIITIPKKAAQITGSKIWLAPGEKISVENLLYATLIHSANDAAFALAAYNSGDSIAEFVKKMNQKAAELGMQQTHFTNPVGFDEKGNYSSAYDLSILGRYAYGKQFIRRAAIIKDMEISSTNGRLTHKISTTNDLLGSYLKVLGLKTGTTAEAGQCLVAVIESGRGHDILTVLLDSSSRYQETKILTDWIFRTYEWY